MSLRELRKQRKLTQKELAQMSGVNFRSLQDYEQGHKKLTSASGDILLRLSEVSTTELSIPIGTLTGSSLLAGRGPAIKVKMQSVGSTTASFRNTFGSAGINQTRHQILLDVQVNMSILLPGFRTSTKVNNEISVAETVIVGSVPENYTYFSTAPNEIDDYAEDYILNNG